MAMPRVKSMSVEDWANVARARAVVARNPLESTLEGLLTSFDHLLEAYKSLRGNLDDVIDDLEDMCVMRKVEDRRP